MRSGRSPKRKGNSGEREFARLVGGRRVPLSGSVGGQFSGDVEWPGVGRGEVKRRKDGFKQLYAWLEGKDFLAVRADSSRYVKRPWLVVMRLDKILEMLEAAQNENG